MSNNAIKTLDSDGLPVYFYHLSSGNSVRAWNTDKGWEHELVLDRCPCPGSLGEQVAEEDWPEGLADVIEREREAVDTSEPDMWGVA